MLEIGLKAASGESSQKFSQRRMASQVYVFLEFKCSEAGLIYVSWRLQNVCWKPRTEVAAGRTSNCPCCKMPGSKSSTVRSLMD